MSDITLTSGIRQNLLSLQQTSADLTTTQEALATGKSVNSAADNPSAYFTSQNLTNSANSLSALLDQIGQGSADDQCGHQRPHRHDQPAPAGAVDGAAGAVRRAGRRQAAATGTVGLAPAQRALAAGTLSIDVGSTTYNGRRSPRARPWPIESASTTPPASAVPAP